MNEHRVGTFCPEHGINCKVDDDGTCSACGASAVGPALAEIERLRTHIEELEGERNHLNERLGWTDEEWKKKHLITNEMIDGAVEQIEHDPSTRHAGVNTWLTLNKLGIERCKGCGGSGSTFVTQSEFLMGGVEEGPCPDCAPWGSKGWVIGDGK